MSFKEFKANIDFSVEAICRDYFLENQDHIQIKKEKVAVKNLVLIIDTTLRLSYENGFHEMSLRDLCKESGLSMGALYSYISSKDDLITMIHDIGQNTVTRLLFEQLKGEENARLKMHIAIRSHLYLSEIMYRWFYFFFMETKNLNKKDWKKPIESELKTESFFIDLIKEGIEDKSFPLEVSTSSELLASSIKALMQDWYLKRWKYKKRKISVESYGDFIITIVESFLYKGVFSKEALHD
jgi:AcrR family transcriptional regulator